MERNELFFQAFNENDQIDRVFQYSYDFLGVNYQHLLIVLPTKCKQPSKTKEWACKQLTSLINVTEAFISFPI
ncbi:hypothetical protein SAMN05216436_1017 [bacterium A37T11]|nr:hypothetical protein SAMN05216436_1017 [bacterium A37T11]